MDCFDWDFLPVKMKMHFRQVISCEWVTAYCFIGHKCSTDSTSSTDSSQPFFCVTHFPFSTCTGDMCMMSRTSKQLTLRTRIADIPLQSLSRVDTCLHKYTLKPPGCCEGCLPMLILLKRASFRLLQWFVKGHRSNICLTQSQMQYGISVPILSRRSNTSPTFCEHCVMLLLRCFASLESFM